MTDTTAPDPAQRPSLEDLLDSITGFEEIAITQAFGRYFAVLIDDATMLARAGIFVLKRREDGVNDAQAKESALAMTMGEVNAYFPDGDDEIDPDEPETPAGEGDSQPA